MSTAASRLGGDEFVLVFPEADGEGLKKVLDRADELIDLADRRMYLYKEEYKKIRK